MRLANVHITNYRSVEDSEEFDVEPGVTCLVGKNESGKTAILKALCRLNSVEVAATFDEVIDFPAKRTRDRKQRGGQEFIPVITAVFELNDVEADRVTKQFGLDTLTSHQFTVSKGYRSPEIEWDFNFDEQKMLSLLMDKLDPTSKQAILGTNSVEEFTEALRALPERPVAATTLLEQLDSWGREGWRCLHSFVAPHLPKFVYFDDYDSMPGKVSIPALIARRDQGTLSRGETALLSLLRIAGAELEDFRNSDNHERLIRELENASASISDEVFKYWSQNRELSVKLEILQPEAGAEPFLSQGPILQIRVYNSRHRASVPLDERSRGFVWFFSFLAYFTELEDTVDQQLILLLDEPGLSLHVVRRKTYCD